MFAFFNKIRRTIIENVLYRLDARACARRRAFINVRPTGPAASIIGAFNV